MKKLEDIGFYTLSDTRAENVSCVSQMKRCEMIINEYCNFKCPYCKGLDKSVFGDRKKKQLTIDEIKQNIDWWCKGIPLENIRFSGGEPTLHPHLIDAVKYAKQQRISRIAVSTNGSNTFHYYLRLFDAGCNDFSISLDASDSKTGDDIAGVKNSWQTVVNNIAMLSQLTYVTVGVVLDENNISRFIDIVLFADTLGVSDIRVIPSAQWNRPLEQLSSIPQSILDRHPILKYRVTNFINGKHVRGMNSECPNKCPLVLDDSVIAGTRHYPCVIYMREHGKPIGDVGEDMRTDRVRWFQNMNTHNDPICVNNCLDVCVDYNRRVLNTNSYVQKLY
jgi:pyruvate-formate lyase-activating enzyme